MDPVFQHGSSSGYIHDGPDFLIAQQHLQAVADMLASTTFQAMDVDPRADATASLSAIRAILSPEPREIRAELAGEAKPGEQVHGNALGSIGGTGTVGIDETGRHDSVATGYNNIETIDAAGGVGIGTNGMEAIGAAGGAGTVPYGMGAVGAADGAGIVPCDMKAVGAAGGAGTGSYGMNTIGAADA